MTGRELEALMRKSFVPMRGQEAACSVVPHDAPA